MPTPTVVLSGSSGDPALTFSAAVAPGNTVVVIFGDGYGHCETLAAISDTAGNLWRLSTLGGCANGDGTVMAATTYVENAINVGDALTPTTHGDWHAYGLMLPGAWVAIDAAQQAGVNGAGTCTTNLAVTSPQVGDFLLAWAAMQLDCTQDAGHGWTSFLTDAGDGPGSDNDMCVAYQMAAAAVTYTYAPTHASSGYGAAAILALSPVLPLAPRAGEVGLVAFPDAWKEPNWFYSGGFYRHGGRVYLQGRIYNSLSGPLGTTLVTGIDPALRPATNVTVTVPMLALPTEAHTFMDSTSPMNNYAMGTDPATPGVSPLPSTIDVTVHTDGTITVPSIPPYATAPPDGMVYYHLDESGGHVPVWSAAFYYFIIVSGISWAAGSGVEVLAWQDLSPYLGSNYTNIDAQYAVDVARVQLRGHVQAINNGATPTQPEKSGGGETEQPLLVNPPHAGDILGDNWLVVGTPRFPAAVQLGSSAYLKDNTRYVGPTSGGGYDQVPGFLKLPVDASGPPAVGAGNWWPIANSNPFGGNGTWDQGDGRSTVAGLSTKAGMLLPFTQFSYPVPCPGGNRCQGRPTYAYSTGGGFSDGTLTLSGLASDYFSVFHPAPDWVALAILFWNGTSSGSGTVTTTLSSPDGAFQALDASGAPISPSFVGAGGSLGVYIGQPGGASQYARDPHNPFLSMLWRPAALPDTWTVTAAFAGVSGIFGPGENVNMHILGIPLWEGDHNFILAGDVIDLTGAGWQAPVTPGYELITPPPYPTVPLGTMQLGPAATGIV